VAAGTDNAILSAGALQELLDGRYAEVRAEIRAVLSRPEFAPVVALPTGEYRERVLGWARALADEGLTAPGFPERFGGHGDPGANVAAFETLLCDLFALHDLEADKGFFQEHGRLSGPRCKAITREVNQLCDEMRQQAAPLVDAFGISDEILAAPIGLK
jgi:hypothetical protein